MPRGRAIVAAIVWAAVVLTWWNFIYGGQVYMCLGPLDVTEASCRAANRLPPLTDWDRFMRGWGPVAILLAAGWVAIGTLDRVLTRAHRGPRRRPPTLSARGLRQRGGL